MLRVRVSWVWLRVMGRVRHWLPGVSLKGGKNVVILINFEFSLILFLNFFHSIIIEKGIVINKVNHSISYLYFLYISPSGTAMSILLWLRWTSSVFCFIKANSYPAVLLGRLYSTPFTSDGLNFWIWVLNFRYSSISVLIFFLYCLTWFAEDMILLASLTF